MAATDAISSLLKRASDAGDVPGVIATAATKDGGVFHEGAFGQRSLAGSAPMTTDTVVRIASMTKAVTGACAMQRQAAARPCQRAGVRRL